jgi:methionyl-tRNA formyltransferase
MVYAGFMSLLFLGKAGDPYSERARDTLLRQIPDATVVLGRRGDPTPVAFSAWRGRYVVSYLSPWIVPADLLARAERAAINFHPGPPEYPGIGCTNFAVYEGATVYGVTCHHMAPRVDTGAIIAVRRFPVTPADDVYSITQRCYAQIATLFEEILPLLAADQPLPVGPEHWTRRPFTRRELNELCELRPEMDDGEIKRRIRAVTFPGAPGAFVRLAGRKFVLADE